MNSVHVSARLTQDPEKTEAGSCRLRICYNKASGKNCYITAIANGRMSDKLIRLKKGDIVWIEGQLSGFQTDNWKTYIQITGVTLPRDEK